MAAQLFDEFFRAEARMFLLAAIRIALSEDGPDLTSEGIFSPSDLARAEVVARQETLVAGLPIIPLVLEFGGADCAADLDATDGDRVRAGDAVAQLAGPVAQLLRCERVILNFLCHLSGIAELTSRYVAALAGSRTRLLDTRKTLHGLRYPEKYAVRVGGGFNHRLNLAELLLVKDNHIDRAGSITAAVERLRQARHGKRRLPVEVECRSATEVKEAVAAGVDRIMLDNMDLATMRASLALIPAGIESEVSCGVSLSNIAEIGRLGPDFVSVGRITHSAPASDFSLDILPGDG